MRNTIYLKGKLLPLLRARVSPTGNVNAVKLWRGTSWLVLGQSAGGGKARLEMALSSEWCLDVGENKSQASRAFCRLTSDEKKIKLHKLCIESQEFQARFLHPVRAISNYRIIESSDC